MRKALGLTSIAVAIGITGYSIQFGTDLGSHARSLTTALETAALESVVPNPLLIRMAYAAVHQRSWEMRQEIYVFHLRSAFRGTEEQWSSTLYGAFTASDRDWWSKKAGVEPATLTALHTWQEKLLAFGKAQLADPARLKAFYALKKHIVLDTLRSAPTKIQAGALARIGEFRKAFTIIRDNTGIRELLAKREVAWTSYVTVFSDTLGDEYRAVLDEVNRQAQTAGFDLHYVEFAYRRNVEGGAALLAAYIEICDDILRVEFK
ncbi:MAG: hypothetical protein AAB421_02660 [Patescibacteria group bacterium]